VTCRRDEVDTTHDHDDRHHGHDDRRQPAALRPLGAPLQLPFQLALRCLAALLIAGHLPLPGFKSHPTV
jgi:hypothetical protein